MELTLRTELMPDYEAVFALYSKAYGGKKESKQVQDLRKTPQFIPELSIVAETEDKKIVGHVIFTPIVIRSTNQNFPSLVLSAVAVHPDFKKKGLKDDVFRHGLDVCHELGFSSVIVSGYQDYYAEMGFKPADQWNIQSSEEVNYNEFMALELRRNALKSVNGIVEYPKGFTAV